MATNQSNTLPFPDPANLRVNPARVLLGVLVLIVVVGGFSSFYQVPASSVAIVQRFGKYLTTTEPGLHFKLPFGLDQVSFVEVRRQLKLEFGYGTRGAQNDYQYNADPSDMELEKNMVPGDPVNRSRRSGLEILRSVSNSNIVNFPLDPTLMACLRTLEDKN